jgi:hypothetical protein
VEEETDGPREDSDSSSVPESAGDPDDTLASGSHPDQHEDKEQQDAQPNKQVKRTAVQNQARFLEIGKSIIIKKPKITSFDRASETPIEAGLVVLIAEVDINRSTHVKSFVTDKDVINRALSVIGKENESEVSDADASLVSGKRKKIIDKAIAEPRSEGTLPDSEAA